MRHTGILALAIAFILPLLGCGSSSSPAAGTGPKRSDADDKVKAAEKATVEAAMAKRDEYARNMQQKLDELDAKYKELVKRAVEAKADAKKVLDEKVKVAKAKRDVAAQKLAELKEAGHDRWEKVKESVGSAIDDLKKIFE